MYLKIQPMDGKIATGTGKVMTLCVLSLLCGMVSPADGPLDLMTRVLDEAGTKGQTLSSPCISEVVDEWMDAAPAGAPAIDMSR
jgi:hypothetical protein